MPNPITDHQISVAEAKILITDWQENAGFAENYFTIPIEVINKLAANTDADAIRLYMGMKTGEDTQTIHPILVTQLKDGSLDKSYLAEKIKPCPVFCGVSDADLDA